MVITITIMLIIITITITMIAISTPMTCLAVHAYAHHTVRYDPKLIDQQTSEVRIIIPKKKKKTYTPTHTAPDNDDKSSYVM